MTKCNANGKILGEFATYDWGPREKGDGTYEDDIFRKQIKYAIDEKGRLCYAFSDKYEIWIIDQEGHPSRKISRDVKPRKVIQDDLDKRFPAKSGKVPYKYIIPERVPFIADIFPLPYLYLLVVTFEKSDDSAFLTGELIDQNGNIVARLKVPKYCNWDFLLAPARSKALCQGDDFYAIETDADEEKFGVKHYTTIWE